MATKVTLNKTSLTLKVGQTYDLDSYIPSGTAAYYRNYTSSNTSVVKMGSSGVVSAKKVGTSTITCKLSNGKYAKCKITVSGSTVKCLDVSKYQGTIDFTKVKAAGYKYVIIRAGYGNLTSQKDPYFETNYTKAKAAGLKVGAYWFGYATSASGATKEANACLSCIKGKTFDMPVYYDVELSSQEKLGKTTLTKMVDTFCSKIESSGYNAGVYSYLNIMKNSLNYKQLANKYSIWLAQWDKSNSISCDVWQYTDKATVKGISGKVDCSYILNLNIIS